MVVMRLKFKLKIVHTVEFIFIQFEYEFEVVCIPMRSHFPVEMRLTDQKNQ